MSESGSSGHSDWDSDLENVPLVLSDSGDSCCSSTSTSPRTAGPHREVDAASSHLPAFVASPWQQQQQQQQQQNGDASNGGSTRRNRRRSSGDGSQSHRTPPPGMPKLSLAGIGGGPATTPSLSLGAQRPHTAATQRQHPLLTLTTPPQTQTEPTCDVPPTTRGTKPPPLALFGRGPADSSPPTSPGEGPPSPSKRTQQQHQQRRQQRQQEQEVRVQLLLPAFEFDVPSDGEQMVGASVRDGIVRALGVSSAYLRYFAVKELPAGQLPVDPPAPAHTHPDDAHTDHSTAAPASTSRHHHSRADATTDSRHSHANGISCTDGGGDSVSGGVCSMAVSVAHSTFTMQTLEGLLRRGARDAAEIAELKKEAAAKEEAYVLAKVAAAEKAAEVERLKAQLAAQHSHEAAQLRSAYEHERSNNAALQSVLLQLRRDHEGLKTQLLAPSTSRDGRDGSAGRDGTAGSAGRGSGGVVVGRGQLDWGAGVHLRGVDGRLVDALTSLSKPGVLDKMTRIIAHMERSNSSSTADHEGT